MFKGDCRTHDSSDAPHSEAGTEVEISISAIPARDKADLYPLRGTPVTFVDPTSPVAEDDWDVLREP
jgi:hypothetical protein